MTPDALHETLRTALATIRELRAANERLEAGLAVGTEPIAIVAASYRLPGGADSPDRFWEVLTGSHDVVRPLPVHRWAHLDFSAFGAAGAVEGWAGSIDDVTGFDAEFFGISDREAILMDPQQRLALELAWEAMERAGWTTADVRNGSTGVILGVAHQDYLFSALVAEPHVGGHLGGGNARSIIANRVSYLLGLTGPSMAVDSACSSSMLAIHLACQSLHTGESDRVFAGGVNLILSPLSTVVTGRSLPFAPDGHCKALAASADGMVRAEGGGVVALRRLRDAVADNDPVLGVILASGTNQDGRTNGLTAPNPVAQSRLLTETLARAGLTPQDVSYIEMHGTGTPLGDPIEVEAIKDAYRSRPDAVCWLGSVKATLGHLEAAAGVASVVKVLETIRHRKIPGQVNLDRLNPEIHLAGSRFQVPTTLTPWSGQGPLTAGVSSFGFGGTNVHLILQEPPPAQPLPATNTIGRPVIISISARSVGGLRDLTERYGDLVKNDVDVDVDRLAAAAARGRTAHPIRAAAVIRDRDPGAVSAALRSRTPPAPDDLPVAGVVLVYPGQTGQWARMGAQLFAADPVIRAELQAWDEEIRRHRPTGLLTDLFGPDSGRQLADTRFAQLAIAALQAAVSAKLRAVGIEPDAVIGHSVGEVSAAFTAGVLDRDQAIRVLLARGDALETHAKPGAMIAVSAPAAQVAEVLSTAGLPRTGIAVVNGPQATVVAGPPADIDTLTPLLRRWRTKRLPTDYAFHAPFLTDAAAQIRTALELLTPGEAHCQLFSTVTGRDMPGKDLDAAHWARNVTDPVDFVGAVASAAATGRWCYVEVGPGATLLPHLTAEVGRGGHRPVVVPVLPRSTDEDLALHQGIAQVWTAGVDLDWAVLYPERHHADLPTYPWQRRPFTVLAADTPTSGAAPARPHPAPGTPTEVTATQNSDVVLALLVDNIARFMGLPSPDTIDPDIPARNLDVDSMAFVELKNAVEDALGVAIPLTALLDGASLRQIAVSLAARRVPTGGSASAGAGGSVPETPTGPAPAGVVNGVEVSELLTRMDEFTEDELDELLARLPGSDR